MPLIFGNERHQTRNDHKQSSVVSRDLCCLRNKKSKFIKSQQAKGLLNNAINNLPFQMHLPGHSFTGPGTKRDKRLNPHLTPKAWSKPINRVDKAAYQHDICYVKAKDTKTQNEKCGRDAGRTWRNI